VPLCAPQIPLTRDRAEVSTTASQRLTAWLMAPSWSTKLIGIICINSISYLTVTTAVSITTVKPNITNKAFYYKNHTKQTHTLFGKNSVSFMLWTLGQWRTDTVSVVLTVFWVKILLQTLKVKAHVSPKRRLLIHLPDYKMSQPQKPWFTNVVVYLSEVFDSDQQPPPPPSTEEGFIYPSEEIVPKSSTNTINKYLLSQNDRHARVGINSGPVLELAVTEVIQVLHYRRRQDTYETLNAHKCIPVEHRGTKLKKATVFMGIWRDDLPSKRRK
jgi:hypothetical protein